MLTDPDRSRRGFWHTGILPDRVALGAVALQLALLILVVRKYKYSPSGNRVVADWIGTQLQQGAAARDRAPAAGA